MNRQQFNSRNNIGQVLTFQKSGTTSSFDPSITNTGSKRVSWKFYNGVSTEQFAGNSLTYTGFTSDTNIRDIEIRGNSFNGITSIVMNNDNLYGNLDFSDLPSLTSLNVITNQFLTGLTFSTSSNITFLDVFSCGISGNLDLSYLNDFGGYFSIALNSNLTGITNPITSTVFTSYQCWFCNITGNLDLSNLSGLGGNVSLQGNSLMTGVTFPTSSTNFTRLSVDFCNIKGNLDLSTISGLGGIFQTNSNTLLTGITHTTSTNTFTKYVVNNCNLIGTLDISMFPNFGGASSSAPCIVSTYSNSNLTQIIFPSTSNFFRNESNSESNGAFGLYSCNLDYVDFTPLSGATLLTGSTQGNPRISLRDNSMSAGDVNHILVDFSGNTTVNPTGWSNVNLNIGGTNSDPDSSSGGYDGLAAIAFLTGSPYNWTITY
jgi:hypothetical protein